MRDRDLWARIAAHPMPDDASGRAFADQLRDAHKISQVTAARAIEEYRRFLYLSATGEGRSVPSKAVDAVWHLHLTHTRDYWDCFVAQVLGGRPIHHEPGSPSGHSADYARTIARYKAEFGEAPPKGIWRRSNPWSDWATTGTVAAFGTTFAWAIVSSGAPTILMAVLLLLVAVAFLQSLAPHLERAGWEVGVDIWSDCDGGDCGGGCGD